MNVLYIHGFKSFFDKQAPKVKTLEKIGNVIGIDLDFGLPFNDIKQILIDQVNTHKIDVIIGTSLGGYWASIVGSDCGIPFVSCNPSTNPSNSLVKHIGHHKTFNNKDLNLTESVLATYQSFATNGCGLILLDMDDELFNYQNTFDLLKNFYQVVVFDGGSHRFDHMEESLIYINQLIHNCDCNYI